MAATDSLRNSFKERAYELLVEIEDSLLELEKRPADSELLWCSLRAAHTLKGSGAMFGFDSISQLAHEVETVLRMAIEGHLTFTREVIDVTLAAHDHIHKALNDSENAALCRSAAVGVVITSLRKIARSGPEGTHENVCSGEEV